MKFLDSPKLVRGNAYHVPNRIGIDIDWSYLRALMAYFNAKYICDDVEVYKTRHGYHIILYTENDVMTNLKVRATLGDDQVRLSLDENRVLCKIPFRIDVLFNVKYNFKSGEWGRAEPTDLLSLPFFSRVPRSYYVEKMRKLERVKELIRRWGTHAKKKRRKKGKKGVP